MIDRIIIHGRVFDIKVPEKTEVHFTGQLKECGGFLNNGLYCESKNSYFYIEDKYNNYEILTEMIESIKHAPYPEATYLMIPSIEKVIPMEILNIERDEETESIILCTKYYPSNDAMRYAINKYGESRGILYPVMEAKQ